MRMKKAIIAVLASTLMILSFFGPILHNQKAFAIAPEQTSWYKEDDGNLGTDYYSLYPYQTNSVKLGFSQFGELIDSNTNVGLEYAGARDPWAELPGSALDINVLPKNVWINGWLLDITYMHEAWGLRNVWIGAMFADLTAWGNPWLQVHAPGSCTLESQEAYNLPGYEIRSDGTINIAGGLYNGGRKTNGTAITDPISVLYDGPRKFIAELVTHVYDVYEPTGATLHLVDVHFTIVFDKVSKEVVLYKEVKDIPHPKFTLGDLQVLVGSPTGAGTLETVPSGILCQFSDREEWDLGTTDVGTTQDYSSYVHFYTAANGDSQDNNLYTAYDSYFTDLPTLPMNVSVPAVNLGVNGTGAFGPEPSSSQADATYDVAQVISNDLKYVGFAAYWPSLSDWSADAGRANQWYKPLRINDTHYTDSRITPNDEPFLAPLTVGEWDFMLSETHLTAGPITADIQFRGVAIYGVTDLNNGDDIDIYNTDPTGQHSNTIDDEVYYQLNMVLNPWDLYSVIDKKDTARWVTKYTGDDSTSDFYLKYSNMFPYKTDAGSPDWPYVYYEDLAFNPNNWDAYNSFSERVLVDGVLQKRDIDYIVDYDIDGYVYIEFSTAPADGAQVKILFSTYTESTFNFNIYGDWEWLAVGRDSAAVDSAGAAIVSENLLWDYGSHMVMSGLDMQDTKFGPATPYILSPMNASLLPDRTGYRDAPIAFNQGRIGLQDDWSSHINANDEWMYGIPISSSNIVTVGGPYANAATEYTNDFTDALVTLPGWTGPGLPLLNIFSVACWSKNNYTAQYDQTGKQTVGYGVISTFEDLNGTVWLVIYGYTGQDTYYTCWSLMHSDVLNTALWGYNTDYIHAGVTTLVLQYNYTLHPTDYCFVTVKEALGTISEFNFQGWFMGVSLDGAGSITPQAPLPPYPDWPAYPIWVTDKYPAIHKDP
jgi:hypothetical protein